MASGGGGTAQQFESQDIHIVKVIGKGTFGTVLRGKLHENTNVAVKCIKVQPERRAVDEFKKEASTLFRLCHDRIVRLYGICKIDDYYCLVMEFCPFALFNVLNTLKAHKEKLPFGLQWRLVMETAQAIKFLHNHREKLLHLDLKSGNILLTEDLRIKLCDFGLSVWQKFRTTSVHANHNVGSRGTRTHMAPEMLKDINCRPNSKCDVYSFAIVMWEVLKGQTDPYPHVRDPHQFVTSVVHNNVRPKFVFSTSKVVSKVKDLDELPKSNEEDVISAMAQLMTICWDAKVSKRPDSTDICSCLESIGQEVFQPPALRRIVVDFLEVLDKCISNDDRSPGPSLMSSDHMTGPLPQVLQKINDIKLPKQKSTLKLKPGPIATGEFSALSQEIHAMLSAVNARPLPVGWDTCSDGTGNRCFADHRRKELTFQDPRLSESDMRLLPGGWQLRFTAEGVPFFVNLATQETQFQDPLLTEQATGTY